MSGRRLACRAHYKQVRKPSLPVLSQAMIDKAVRELDAAKAKRAFARWDEPAQDQTNAQQHG